MSDTKSSLWCIISIVLLLLVVRLVQAAIKVKKKKKPHQLKQAKKLSRLDANSLTYHFTQTWIVHI